MSNSERTVSRRRILKGGLRTILFGGIVSVCGALGLRKSRASGDETVCVFELPCAHCEISSGCTDPKALKSKQSVHSKIQTRR